MIDISWTHLSILLGVLFIYLWFQDFRRVYKTQPKGKSFFASYKFKETLYFILVISIPIFVVNFSGLDGLAYHNTIVLFISSIILAFSISLVWFLYLARVDRFEKEPLGIIGLVFILGSGFTFLVFPITEFVQTSFDFRLNGDLWNDWWYCVFGIGMVEELVKIIPFLLILKFSKQVNEPFDYIFYASVSALGFAFIENTLYLNNSILTAIYGRALFSSIAHMFFSSIIAYGFVYLRYIKVNLRGFQFPILLLIASFAHGFYDFWLINETASTFHILTTLFFLLSIYLWAMMINNTLNISPFYDLKITFRKDRLKYRIINLLITTFYLAYLMTFFMSDKYFANRLLISSWEINVFVLLFLAFNLSQFQFLKGYLASLNFKSSLLFLVPRIYSSNNLTGKKVHLYIPQEMKMRAGKSVYRTAFPIEGALTRRIAIRGNVNCYIVKIDQKLAVKGTLKNHVVIKMISKEEDQLSAVPRPMVVYALRSSSDFLYGEIPESKLVFIHDVFGIEVD